MNKRTKQKWVIAIIVLVILCGIGILCWKVVMYRRGEKFSVFSGLDEAVTPTSVPQVTITPTLTPAVTPTPIPIGDILVTENTELMELLKDKDATIFDGTVPDVIYVIDDTVGIEKNNDELIMAEFFAKDSGDVWYSFSYEKESGKVLAVNCDKEHSEFVEDKTRTKLSLSWVDLKNTENYESELFSETSKVLLDNLQYVLFDGEYYKTYKSLDHARAGAYLNEVATYAEFVFYAENLRSIVNDRVSDEFVANLLGCDKRGDYAYVGVQIGNYNVETEEYRKVTDIWCTVFLPKDEEDEYGFWLFGPGILEQIVEQIE